MNSARTAQPPRFMEARVNACASASQPADLKPDRSAKRPWEDSTVETNDGVVLVLSMDGELPDRHDPDRCADRSSPNAQPLFREAVRARRRTPDGFPIATHVALTIVARTPEPDRGGYDAFDPVTEVLVDAGILADERLVSAQEYLVDPGSAGYSVAVTPDDSFGHGPERVER
jgi:hypothetical protein